MTKKFTPPGGPENADDRAVREELERQLADITAETRAKDEEIAKLRELFTEERRRTRALKSLVKAETSSLAKAERRLEQLEAEREDRRERGAAALKKIAG